MQKSTDGTIKWLSKLSDGEFLETVLIPIQKRLRPSDAAPLPPPGSRLRPSDAAPGASAHRRTVCVSTQVGCAYGCVFCASGLNGFRRNLTPGEIVQQVLLVQRSLQEATGPVVGVRHRPPANFGGLAGMGTRPHTTRGFLKHGVTNVVLMGMGEPLANYDNLLKAIRILNTPEGLHVGARKITVSTVGLVPMIERLSKERLQIELSISLHAPSDELRGKLMPINKKYPVVELIEACHDYVKATNRLITFEYILIRDVNDGMEQAKELATLLKNLKAKVNLIPCHPIPGSLWKRPPLARMLAFGRFLRDQRIPCTLRRSRGLDIDGACGQLRLRHKEAAPLPPPESRLRLEDTSPRGQRF